MEFAGVEGAVALFTDACPQGRDLYDAVLPTERHSLDRDLLLRVLEPAISQEMGVSGESVDEWKHVTRDCPWAEGTCGEWLTCCEEAMAPAFRRGWLGARGARCRSRPTRPGTPAPRSR